MDSDVAELLKTWELSELIPIFAEQRITVQALSALTFEDLKELIPHTGPRVLFTRCWQTWKTEFTRTTLDNLIDNISLSNLDLSNLQFGQEIQNYGNCSINDPKNSDYIVVSLEETEKENTPPSLKIESKAAANPDTHNNPETLCIAETKSEGVLENLLKKSLETSSLLIYKGGSLDGDATRNLLAAVIAKEILQENKNAPIVGHIYFRWVKLINELFPGERTTTYYIPACTTASGVVLQARGKLVHQVLNKRRRLQQLGSLSNKKRNREGSPGPSSSNARPLPNSLSMTDLLNFEEDILWLQNSSEPWHQVEMKWRRTVKKRIANLHDKEKYQSIEAYCNSYPALKKPCGYTLLLIDFEEIYAEHKEKLFIHFPVAKIKILDLLKTRKSKDEFCQELINLADSSKEENKNLAAFLAIPYLLNTSTIKQKKKRKITLEPTCSWKPSKAETRDAFIKHVRSDAEVGHVIELRLRMLNDREVSPQPYIIIVGESLAEIKTFLVIINPSVIYQRNNILQAFDTCYKAIWALNAEYGSDSYAIWYFLQQGIYKMTSKFDKGSTTAESLLTDCNF